MLTEETGGSEATDSPLPYTNAVTRSKLEVVANLAWWCPQFNYIKVDTGRSKPLDLLLQTEGSVNIGDHYKKRGPMLDGLLWQKL
ncbi:hypothetical protein AAC387_Pa07g3759 [Persea americana]